MGGFVKLSQPGPEGATSAPRWVRVVRQESLRSPYGRVAEVFIAAFAGRRLDSQDAAGLRDAAVDCAGDPSAFAAAAKAVLERLETPDTLPNFFFICYDDQIDSNDRDRIEEFSAGFEGSHKNRLFDLAAACIDEVPAFLGGWFSARGYDENQDGPRSDFFRSEYEIGVVHRALPSGAMPIPQHGGQVQIVPKVSAHLLLGKARASDRGTGAGRRVMVPARIEIIGDDGNLRIRKFLRDEEFGDRSPRQLLLIDSESLWNFTIGNGDWDDIFVPDLVDCRAELRITVQRQPFADTPLVTVAADVPKGCPRLESDPDVRRPIRHRLRIRPAHESSSRTNGPPIVQVHAFDPPLPLSAVADAPLFNPVFRVVARLLPRPVRNIQNIPRDVRGDDVFGARRFGKATLPGLQEDGPSAESLNSVEDFLTVGTVPLKSLLFGIDRYGKPFFKVLDDAPLRQLSLTRRGDELPIGNESIRLEHGDEIRVSSPTETLRLLWKNCGEGGFIDGLKDVFAGGFQVSRERGLEGTLVRQGEYETIDPQGGPNRCVLIGRSRATEPPAWQDDRAVTQMPVGDPYLPHDGIVTIAPVLRNEDYQVVLKAVPNLRPEYRDRVFFEGADFQWYRWDDNGTGKGESLRSVSLAAVEEIWSKHLKMQRFVLGSTLISATLSGTV